MTADCDFDLEDGWCHVHRAHCSPTADAACPWLVERRRTAGHRCAEGCDEGCWAAEMDAEAGPEVIECGAPMTVTADGWHCEAGHEHLTYGSRLQQAQERLEARAEREGW